MFTLILKALYFFLPAYGANLAPVLFKRIPFLEKPIHQKTFGQNQTWRSFLVAIIIAPLIFLLQKYAYRQGFQSLAVIDYGDFSLLLGFLLGIGAVLGSLMKSYYCHQEKIKPKKYWKPWGQLDFIIGSLLLSFFVYVPPAAIVLIIILLSPLLYWLIKFLGTLILFFSSRKRNI